MYTIKMPNGSILATTNESVARGYINYGGGTEIDETEVNEKPKARRGRKPKSESVSSSSETE